MLANLIADVQGQLFYIVESDDLYLEQLEQVAWFGLLRDMDWQLLRPVAAKYYEQLYRFNVEQAKKRGRTLPPNPETQDEATLRLLYERATLDEEAEILHQPSSMKIVEDEVHINPELIAPGAAPPRWAGRAPKCFFAMLKAFIGVAVSGVSPEPEQVHAKLIENPAFARTCGFTLPNSKTGYQQSDIPSLRKLEQFDQIMSQAGLWAEARVLQVRDNLQSGKINLESTIVHDTTHYHAYSQGQQVPLQTQQPAAAGDDGDKDTAKAPAKKSHPKTTKACQCADRDHCGHPWINADDGAGTVVKSGGKMFWAHKASTISFAHQEVPLDAVAITDAAAHDSKTLPDHIARLLSLYPELDGQLERVLDDGAADEEALKNLLWGEWGLELLTPINPRGRKAIVAKLPKGVDHLTPRGVPVCLSDYPLDFIGCRHDTQRFLFRAPNDSDGNPVCQNCTLKDQCYRGDSGARQVTIPFERLPWIDPEFPQLSKRFAKEMSRRTVIERVQKLMKFDYGDARLTKRSNDSFQATLDKTLLAMHLVIAQD